MKFTELFNSAISVAAVLESTDTATPDDRMFLVFFEFDTDGEVLGGQVEVSLKRYEEIRAAENNDEIWPPVDQIQPR